MENRLQNLIISAQLTGQLYGLDFGYRLFAKKGQVSGADSGTAGIGLQ